MSRFVLSVLAAALCVACPGPQVACRVGADCASGVCNSDGTCGTTPDGGTTDGGSSDGGSLSDGGGADAGPGTDDGGHQPYDAGNTDAGPRTCAPNGDGVIERGELYFRPGLSANYRVSGAATFDTTGTAQTDGGRSWDFTPALSGDQTKLIETQAITGQWFESSFPDAGYIAPFGSSSLGHDLLGVFSATDAGLFLLGVASTTNTYPSTNVAYDPPIELLQFPLQAGNTWSTSTSVSGTYDGVFISYLQTEDYAFKVDRGGTAVTPFASFPVLRVRAVMQRTANFISIATVRSFQWVTECFGTVATVSADSTTYSSTPATEFTSAGEVRRLTP